MSEKITEERLAELQALADAAQPGEWTVLSGLPGSRGTEIRAIWIPVGDTRKHTRFIVSVPEQAADPGIGKATAAFIAAARTVVPELIAEVRRQRPRLNAPVPTEPGYYWSRDKDGMERIVYVYWWSVDVPRVCLHGSEIDMPLDAFVEWSARIEEPEVEG